MKVRALLSSAVVLIMVSLVGCGHYNCSSGAQFGNSTCTATGGGLSSGGGGTTGTAAVFDFFFDSGQLDGSLCLDTALVFFGVYDLLFGNFVDLVPRVSSGIGGMTIVQKQWMYISFNGSPEVEGYSIDGTTGALTAISGGPPARPLNAMVGEFFLAPVFLGYRRLRFA